MKNPLGRDVVADSLLVPFLLVVAVLIQPYLGNNIPSLAPSDLA